MMTGRELIIYILENGLEDEPMFKDGKPLGFMTTVEAAVKFGVGNATVMTWICLNQIRYIQLGEKFYIPANEKSPLEVRNEKDSKTDVSNTSN